jgi:anti-anti-sigma regulatory factor
VLRITITDTQTESRWILQGKLVGPWVRELRSCWKNKHRTHDWQKCVVDLNDVTFIDKSGERLLRAMSKKGAELVASGIYTKHLLDKLKTTGKHDLFRPLACLFAGFVLTAIPLSCPARVKADLGELSTRPGDASRHDGSVRGRFAGIDVPMSMRHLRS